MKKKFMKKKIISIMLIVCLILSVLQKNTVSVFAESSTNTISGDYVLIINSSLTDAQQSGTISFNDTTPFGASTNAMTSSKATAAYIEDMYKQEQIGASANLTANTQEVTKSYNIGDTKTMSNGSKFTLRGIGNKCYIWMDDTTYSLYTQTTLSTAIADIIKIYDESSYPVLKTLGADTKMNYADGSGKLSIFLEKNTGTASGYFSHYDMYKDMISCIHIPLSTARTSFWGYGALLAHEGQHALNASTQNFSSWINEGLSIAAMDMYYNGKDGLGWLNDCMQDLDAKSGAALAHTYYTRNNSVDYSIPFLFLRYLNAQANKGFNPNSDFYSKFYTVASNGTGLNKDTYIIEQVLKQYDSFKNSDGTYWNFEQAFTNFRIAAFKQDDTGIYGFYGDSVVKDKIGGPALYFGQSGKSLKIEPTGGIIVKTNNGSFDIPSDAGANIKFIPFNGISSLPTNQYNKMSMGGKIDTTIIKNQPITFEDLRIVITDSNGNYSKIYKGLSELYMDGYSLLAIRAYGAANQSNYALGTNPNDTIKEGDTLFIRKGTAVINSFSDFGTSCVSIGNAKILNVAPLPEHTVTVSSNNEAWGTASGGGAFKEGTLVTVKATANSDSSFVNWTEGGVKVSTDAAYTFTLGTSNRNLVANFAHIVAGTYTVTYNGNGSTKGTVPNDSNNYKEMGNVTVANNTGSLVKLGYTFAGWNTKADGKGTDYAAGSSFKMGLSNVTLYAKWVNNSETNQTYEYKLTVGTYSETEDLYAVCKREFGPNATLADWNDIKANYSGNIKEFLDKVSLPVGYGENTKAAYVQVNGERFYYSTRHYFIERHDGSIPLGWGALDQIGSNYLDLGSWYGIKLKALVRIPVSKYTVTFNSNGGAGILSQSIMYNSKAVKPTNPTKVGYTFGGWYKDAKCTNAWNFTTEKVYANTTLYAKWIINKYTIAFNSQGGNAVSSKTVNYNSTITVPTVPTKTGYKFGGWYKEAGCKNAWNFTTEKVYANTTLYAKWIINKYTVVFNSQGGNALSIKIAYYNSTITVPTVPRKTGYKFGGWYKEAVCKNVWNFTTYKVKINTILYAKWIKNK
jgi:uncharacterized repeat protein (TIGR02543 family)